MDFPFVELCESMISIFKNATTTETIPMSKNNCFLLLKFNKSFGFVCTVFSRTIDQTVLLSEKDIHMKGWSYNLRFFSFELIERSGNFISCSIKSDCMYVTHTSIRFWSD